MTPFAHHLALGALASVLVLAAAPRSAAAAFAIRGFVIGCGATPVSGLAGSGRSLLGTAGQAAVGASAGANHELCHGFWCAGGTSVVSVEPPPGLEAGLPTTLALGLPRPNPARGAVVFAIDLPRASRVDLRVLDVQGRLVREVERGARNAGFHHVAWDGRRGDGQRAGPGVFFARLVVDGAVIGTRRIVLRD